MPAEVYNPNPTVFSPAKSAGRKSEYSGQSLWLDDKVQTEDDADQVDPIDPEEIFGSCRSNPFLINLPPQLPHSLTSHSIAPKRNLVY